MVDYFNVLPVIDQDLDDAKNNDGEHDPGNAELFAEKYRKRYMKQGQPDGQVKLDHDFAHTILELAVNAKESSDKDINGHNQVKVFLDGDFVANPQVYQEIRGKEHDDY
jgi:hypothetical protein